MLKEIMEQSAIIRRIYKGRVDFDEYTLTADAYHGLKDQIVRSVTVVASGTSYHSGRLGTLYMDYIAGIDARARIASEYENVRRNTTPGSLHIAVSQSGETADCI